MQTRLTIVEQFSSFLLVTDSERFITRWHIEPKLKRNLEKIRQKKTIKPEDLAYQLLENIKQKSNLIEVHHLTAYLQEVCYWASKEVYNRLGNMIKSLTREECFLLANSASLQPQKLLARYCLNGGSKITTYAQTRLKTVISDLVYQQRGWKLCSDWGLLKKMSKINRQKSLTEIGGLTGEKLQAYLLVWQCFTDNVASSSPHKNRKLSPPNSGQLQLMTKQYNLLANKLFKTKSQLTVNQLQTRLEFCCKIARQFTNPQTVSYPENFELTSSEVNPITYLEVKEANQESAKINHTLSTAFNNMSLERQAVMYLLYGLNLTQEEVIKILPTTYPNFITKQYQLSREMNKIRQVLLKAIIQPSSSAKKAKISTEKLKALKQPIEQWLNQYIQSQLFITLTKSYHQLTPNNQQLIKDTFSTNSSTNLEIIKPIKNQLMITMKQKLTNQFNLPLDNYSQVKSHLNLFIDEFLYPLINNLTIR